MTIHKNYCLSKDEGISMMLTPAFGLGQQLFHIYDGPAYQDSNVYLDITATPCPNPGCMYNNGSLLGVPKDNNGSCYLPNAAIGWKQPNGFFYPPAFHSTNLFFSNVDIRHYVVDPLFQAPQGVTGTAADFGQGGTYLTATSGPNNVKGVYCTATPDMFTGFTGIDRQTVLNDDDGSLTGLRNTISINEDVFFGAPWRPRNARATSVSAPRSLAPKPSLPRRRPPGPAHMTISSPLSLLVAHRMIRHLTRSIPKASVDFPYGRCGDDPVHGFGGQRWSSRCSTQDCYGVPLYRQLLTNDDLTRWNALKCMNNGAASECRWPFIRMSGFNIYHGIR